MAKKARPEATSRPADRKRRTREHVIADLSVNFVERVALRSGYTVQRVTTDYGYDLLLQTYGPDGGIEPEYVHLQLKASDRLEDYALAGEECFSFPVSTRDYRGWSEALLPVLLVLYDVASDEGYWLHVQDYARDHAPGQGAQMRLRVPRLHVLGTGTLRVMRRVKREVVRRMRGGR